MDERLRKRNFKDGNWQCILLGVLSLVEHVPQYETTIIKFIINWHLKINQQRHYQ